MDTARSLATFIGFFLTLLTTAIFAVSDVDPLGCSITWYNEDKTATLNGVLVPEISTSDECQEYCVNKPHCVAVEWDYSNRDSHGCWFHENINDLGEFFVMDSVMHYTIKSSCPERSNGAPPVQPVQVYQSSARSLNWQSNSGLFIAALTMICVLLVNQLNV